MSPTLLDSTQHLESLVGPTRESMGSDRPGIHISSLISEIELKLRMKSAAPFPDGYLFAIAGIAWEGWVRSRLGEEDQGYIWQLEGEADGITGTADALDVNNNEIIECKLTWMGANRDLRDVWKYMAQIKAYCYMFGVSVARMYVYHVQFPPVIRVVRMEFSDEELNSNWMTILSQKQSRDE